MKPYLLATAVSALLLSACGQKAPTEQEIKQQQISDLSVKVAQSNAELAYLNYLDSLQTAKQMRDALQTFVQQPGEATFAAAKQAWLTAREPYGQTEVFRFREGPIDTLRQDGTYGSDGDGAEGRINAWPLGEALIDYVAMEVDGNAGPENPANRLQGNMIADVQTFPEINKQVLSEYFEYGEDERNVTTGYHAIEFLLWGQDQNQSGDGLRDNTPGLRPVSDYYTQTTDGKSQCTSGTETVPVEICQRRGAYLLAAADLLIDDLQPIVNAWDPQTGAHYKKFVAAPQVAVSKILEGMGRLSFGELAGERINIALSTDSQEDEHSCFSDNTHRDIYLNALGIENSFLARYTASTGKTFQGQSVYDLVVLMGDQAQADALKQQLAITMQSAAAIDAKAKAGQPFDVLIQQGVSQPEVRAIIASLVKQTDEIEKVIRLMKLSTGELRQDTEQELSQG